jgi:hypothetical protein
MTRIPLIFLFLVLTIPVAAQNKNGRPAPTPAPAPSAKPTPSPTITRIRLDKNQITSPCPEGFKAVTGTCSDDPANFLVKVETIMSSPAPPESSFEYSVTGGVVNGGGLTVEWDVRELAPGNYKLTSTLVVGDTRPSSKTVTITVYQCRSCMLECQCPQVAITVPEKSVPAGETLTFTATVTGPTPEPVTYNWSVSSGEIVGGQGTQSIQVRTFPGMGGTKIVVTLEIGGTRPACNCPTKHSAEAPELLNAERERKQDR